MFSVKDKNGVETIIGLGTEFKGTVTSKGSLRIDGKLEGEILAAEGIILGETGVIRGNINAKTVIICGKVIGNINAGVSIEVLNKAQVHGDIRSVKITIAEGAAFEGNCAMSTEKLNDYKAKESSSEPVLDVLKEHGIGARVK